MTPGQRYRLLRDAAIYLAHEKGGMSQRKLAWSFVLSRSRVGEIVKEQRSIAAGRRPETGHAAHSRVEGQPQ